MTTSAVQPIVVGYDASKPSEAALQWAARAADHSGRGLEVFHSAEILSMRPDGPNDTWQASTIKAEAERVAVRGAEVMGEEFPQLKIKTVGGLFNVKTALAERSVHASMLVLGNHGRGRISTALLGSTAYTMAGYAKCPVVVVRDGSSPPPGPKHPVVVAANDSPGSDRAVESAAHLAREWGAPLVIVTSWKPAPPDPWDKGPLGYNSVKEASAAYLALAERTNEKTVGWATSANPDLQIEARVVKGHPVDALAEAARGAGVLVSGTRGHGRLVGTLLGSTSMGLLRQATVPVMVVD